MAIDFHLIWKDQCDAAEAIRERDGVDQAMGYLIGEKLVNFVRAADTRPSFADELPNFIARTKSIFEPHELLGFFDSVKQIGALGHVCSNSEHQFLREHGAIEDDPVSGAEDILIMQRIRELLLAELG